MAMIFCSPRLVKTDAPVLKDKRVLIVGGTHGVGEAVARRCLAGGAYVTVVGLTHNYKLDCAQETLDVVSFPHTVKPLMKNQDYVFNNIGMIWKGEILNTPRSMLQRFLKYNIEIMFLLNQYALEHAKEVVVNMSSRPIFSTYKGWSLYALTKHAIIDLTKAAAEEGKQKFYAVCPSRMDTKFRDSVCPDEDKSTRLQPDQAAEYIVTLFNGKNPSGQHYWIRKHYKNNLNRRGF